MIPFTQYLMPDGRKRQESTVRPPEIEKMAHSVIAKGYKFEIEVLNNGYVNMEVVGGEEDKAIAHEITVNGPEVIAGVDKLVTDAFKVLKL